MYRRRQGKPSPMRPVLVRIGIGALVCIAAQAVGYQYLGSAALALAAMAGYWSWE